MPAKPCSDWQYEKHQRSIQKFGSLCLGVILAPECPLQTKPEKKLHLKKDRLKFKDLAS